MRFLLESNEMVDLFQKRLKLVFEDGFLISKTFFGVDFEDDPRFFDTIAIYSIFGKPDSIPIEGAFEHYYEKVEIDAFRRFLINWDPDLADFEPDYLPVTDVPKILDVVKAYTFPEKRHALSIFYGTHFNDVRDFLNMMLFQIPNTNPYGQMVHNMRELRDRLASDFTIQEFEKRITKRVAEELFNYWVSSPMNFTKNYFGPFGRWAGGGII